LLLFLKCTEFDERFRGNFVDLHQEAQVKEHNLVSFFFLYLEIFEIEF